MKTKTIFLIILGVLVIVIGIYFAMSHETITITELPAQTLPGVLIP